MDFALGYDFKENCDYYVQLATGTHTAQICLFQLTEARYFPAKLVDSQMIPREAEPWRGKVAIIDLNLAQFDKIMSRHRMVAQKGAYALKRGIATKNPHYNAQIAKIENVCMRTSEPIQLTGESGVGKTELAKGIYDLRRDRHLVEGSFVGVNCATLEGDTVLSELFGHKKGAFTGAAADRPGLLKEADNGILFLDEIGELPLSAQAKLLTALEAKEYYPVGSDKLVKSNFQIIVGTNRDLREEVRKGRFREDFYNRIKMWTFRLPSLRERREDIEPNVDFELDRVSMVRNRRVSFNDVARAKYLEFALQAPWPGNFRDLRDSIMRMATLSDGGRIVEYDVNIEIEQLKSNWGEDATVVNTGQLPGTLDLVSVVLPASNIDLYDRVSLEAMFLAIKNSSSMAEAGRKLFAVSRQQRTGAANDSQRVWVKLKSLGLTYDEVKARVDAVGAPSFDCGA
jgi:transcriptional regulatory protein RtcR